MDEIIHNDTLLTLLSYKIILNTIATGQVTGRQSDCERMKQ